MSRRVINERHAPKTGLDFYATPEWATRALLHYCVSEWPDDLVVWEPAAGDERMVDVLHERWSVFASDVADRNRVGVVAPHDFLSGQVGAWPFSSNTDGYPPIPSRRNLAVITNPPFNLAEQFISKALQISEWVAILGRLSLLEGKKRYPLFKEHPPSKVMIFTERVAFIKDGDDENYGKVAGVAAHAWFVWDNPLVSHPSLGWIPPCREWLTARDPWGGTSGTMRYPYRAPQGLV